MDIYQEIKGSIVKITIKLISFRNRCSRMKIANRIGILMPMIVRRWSNWWLIS